MFHIFILVALSGVPQTVAESKQGFDTKEACVAGITDFVKAAQAQIPQGYEVIAAVCATEDDFNKATKAKGTEANNG